MYTTVRLDDLKGRAIIMEWKKYAAAGMAAILTATFVAGCGGDKQADKGTAAKRDKIVIGLDDNFPPFGFHDESGELVGFDIDMAKEASKRLGMEVEFKPIDWDSKEAALKSKQVDMLWNGLTITDERSQQIAFSKPYMNNAQLLVVRADSPINDRAGLAGKVIGTQEGSSSIDALEKNAEFKDSLAEVKKYGDFVNAFMDLEIGRTDGILVDSVVGRYYMAKKPGKFKVIDDKMGDEKFGVGMRKEDTLLQDKLNDVLKQMSEDGTMTKLSQKWFNEDITIKVQ